ncbi:MAG: asparagine synthase C-terminal domain-containing protein [Thermoproteota archaeon]|nr:asparagine synthase C-terminal domain-containing protein [Thermoproteota archaeon]
MLTRLKNALFSAVQQAIGNETRLAIAFSGGLDSTLLATICKEMGKDATLLTVGFSQSKDIAFSRDIAHLLNMSHKILKLDSECFQEDADRVYNKIRCNITSHIENCVAFLYIGRLAHDNDLRCVLTANGCDELFCGYDRFRSIYPQGANAIMVFLEEKLESELVLMQEINKVTLEFQVGVKQPFLSPDFINFAKTIPIEYKITGPGDMMRKHILRQAALLIGVPMPSVTQRKRALQYGSLIHKNLRGDFRVTR